MHIYILNEVTWHTMAPKRRGPASDSLAANPRAALALDQLFSTDTVREGDKASIWYNDKGLQKIFATVDPENFRKRYKKLYDAKFSADANLYSTEGSIFHAYTIICSNSVQFRGHALLRNNGVY